jgi:RimJ/RimL family protein N-acetyltransferase
VFADPALHAFTGGTPATEDELRSRYAAQVAGPADGGAEWHNWMLRRRDRGELVGTVQATVTGTAAELAWVVAVPHQRSGYAREGATAVAGWLRGRGVVRFVAHIHPEHAASAGVARALGLAPTDTVVDGEIRWAGTVGGSG